MDSYIVRIYRRDTACPERITGVVEIVGRQETQAFRSLGELASILEPAVGARCRECPPDGGPVPPEDSP